MIGCRLYPGRSPGSLSAYRLGPARLIADAPLAALGALRLPDTPPPLPAWPDRTGPAPRQRIFAGDGWIANADRAIEAWWGPAGYVLRVRGVGTFLVGAKGDAIALNAEGAAVGQDHIEEALLGPPVVLALALKGVWCLHASAVHTPDGVLAFLGVSGSGKSTLARYLDGQGPEDWRRVGDDLLPVQSGCACSQALPHFPQLKLPPRAQYALEAPTRLPLAGLFLLDPRPGDDQGPVSVQPVAGRALAAALVRHTVASRLFAPHLLGLHLQTAAALARHVKGFRLSYSQRLATLPDLGRVIRATQRGPCPTADEG